MDNWDLKLEVEDINNSRPTVVIRTDKRFAAKVVEHVEPYKHIPAMFKPALEDVADYVRGTMIPRVFNQEGPGWRPLAPRTVAERIAAGYPGQHPILQRSRDLYKELTEKSHPGHIEVIKVGKDSRIEVGGSSKKFRDNQLGDPTTHLPARPMIPGTGGIPIPEMDRIHIRGIFESVKRRAKR